MTTDQTRARHYRQRLDAETDCADVHARAASDDPTLVIVDARTADDHRRRHVPGAISLPHREITAEMLTELVGGRPDVEFITYCWGPHCNGATKAAANIADAGFSVREMLGGMWGWEQEGYRFEGDDVAIEVGILTFDQVDLMDVAGPYEVFVTAERLAARRGAPCTFHVDTIGTPVRAYGGLGLAPSRSVDDVQRLDVLLVPGAIDLAQATPDAALRSLATRAEVIASVCTGAFFLQRNGLLGDGPATTHWEDIDDLDHPDIRGDVRWVDNGAVVTSGGISSGIAMALHLVERFADRELAEATARQIDYVWTEQRELAH